MDPLFGMIAALILYEWMKTPIFVIVVDDKGGVGKSLIAQIFAELLRYKDGKYIVRLLDTDYSNSTTMQTEGSEVKMIDLREKVAMGIIANVLREIDQKTISHVVMDVGAREESLIANLLPFIVPAVKKLGGEVVVVRPVTLGSHNQRSAAAFMDIAEKLGINVVFVRNEGQGRRSQYFDRWIKTETRTEALARGAVETVLEDANIFYADEATGFGITLADAALQDFSKIKDETDRLEAEAFFNDDIAAFLTIWLRNSVLAFGAALDEAITKRKALEAERLATPPSEVLAPDVSPKLVGKQPKPKKS